MLLGEVAQVRAGSFNCRIVWIESLEKFRRGKAAGGERFDYTLDLRCDHVPLRELWVLKQVPHQPFSEQMLDKHLIDVALGEIRIEGCPAKSHKRGERVPKPLVLFVRFINVFA